MAIIQFTAADKMAAVTMDAGWQPSMITEVKAAASKSMKSINYWVTFRVIEGKYLGKEQQVCFNSEVNTASVLGSMQFLPAELLLRVAAAIEKKTLDEVALELDTDKLAGQQLDVYYALDTPVGGQPMNIVTNWLPFKTGSTAPAFS